MAALDQWREARVQSAHTSRNGITYGAGTFSSYLNVDLRGSTFTSGFNVDLRSSTFTMVRHTSGNLRSSRPRGAE